MWLSPNLMKPAENSIDGESGDSNLITGCLSSPWARTLHSFQYFYKLTHFLTYPRGPVLAKPWPGSPPPLAKGKLCGEKRGRVGRSVWGRALVREKDWEREDGEKGRANPKQMLALVTRVIQHFKTEQHQSLMPDGTKPWSRLKNMYSLFLCLLCISGNIAFNVSYRSPQAHSSLHPQE